MKRFARKTWRGSARRRNFRCWRRTWSQDQPLVVGGDRHCEAVGVRMVRALWRGVGPSPASELPVATTHLSVVTLSRCTDLPVFREVLARGAVIVRCSPVGCSTWSSSSAPSDASSAGIRGGSFSSGGGTSLPRRGESFGHVLLCMELTRSANQFEQFTVPGRRRVDVMWRCPSTATTGKFHQRSEGSDTVLSPFSTDTATCRELRCRRGGSRHP